MTEKKSKGNGKEEKQGQRTWLDMLALARGGGGHFRKILKGVSRQACGLANDETRADLGGHVFQRLGGFEAREQVVDGLGGEVAAGHAHGGEGRNGVLG